MYAVLPAARQNDPFFPKTTLKPLTGYLLKTDQSVHKFNCFHIFY